MPRRRRKLRQRPRLPRRLKSNFPDRIRMGAVLLHKKSAALSQEAAVIALYEEELSRVRRRVIREYFHGIGFPHQDLPYGLIIPGVLEKT